MLNKCQATITTRVSRTKKNSHQALHQLALQGSLATSHKNFTLTLADFEPRVIDAIFSSTGLCAKRVRLC